MQCKHDCMEKVNTEQLLNVSSTSGGRAHQTKLTGGTLRTSERTFSCIVYTELYNSLPQQIAVTKISLDSKKAQTFSERKKPSRSANLKISGSGSASTIAGGGRCLGEVLLDEKDRHIFSYGFCSLWQDTVLIGPFI